MLVNHIQVAYVLQITPLEAKFMLAPHIERIREMVIPGKKGSGRMRKARQENRRGRKPLAEYQIPPSEPRTRRQRPDSIYH